MYNEIGAGGLLFKKYVKVLSVGWEVHSSPVASVINKFARSIYTLEDTISGDSKSFKFMFVLKVSSSAITSSPKVLPLSVIGVPKASHNINLYIRVLLGFDHIPSNNGLVISTVSTPLSLFKLVVKLGIVGG